MNLGKTPKILISTGIFPPALGGPAEYARNLQISLKNLGLEVEIKTYGFERKLPTGVRHLFYFFKILPSVLRADYIIALDTFSVGLLTVLVARMLGKKVVIRTGGDFLWESYVERTGQEVLLRNFYKECQGCFNLKEQIIFKLTAWTLAHASAVVWSTLWQRDIFLEPYGLANQHHYVIENYYAPKKTFVTPAAKIFVAGTRDLKWKNQARLKRAFGNVRDKFPDISLDTSVTTHSEFIEKIKNSYAVALVSLGDISPNMILEAVSFNKPFILTRETGLYDKLQNIAVFVDPMSEKDIEEKIAYLLDSVNYERQVEKIKHFNFVHTYDDIAREFLKIYNEI
jgi:glycosyltransferase involved in cell wall biosynthesis